MLCRFRGISRTEHPITGNEAVHQAAKRKHVVRGDRRLTGKHLHARIRWRRRSQSPGIESRIGSLLLLPHSRDAEVDQLHLSGWRDHDVGRLDVRVHHTAAVSVIQCLPHLPDDVEDHIVVDVLAPASIQNAGERAALQPLHDHEIQVLVPIEINEAHDVGVRQAAAFCRLLL